MKDFFTRQDEARRTTRRLVVLFALAVAAIVVAVYLAVVILLFGAGLKGIDVGQPGLWRPELFAWVAAATLLVILGGSSFKSWQLRAGGPAVAELLGGRPVDPNTDDPDERRLLNVVEEMAIASGTKVPDVYLLDDERGINAFAAGHDPDDMVIGVTRGTAHLLTRDELQGVIAHEFSHILHGDVRLDLRLMGLVFGILAISTIGYYVMRGGSWSSRRRKGAGLALVGLALFVIGWIGVFFGRLIKAAVSRQREFLADASAVQYTRNPSGIAGALRKIGGSTGGSRIRSGRAEEASHLFFADGLKERWFGMTATHPPLDERIRRIDPSFDGTYPEVRWPEEAEEVPPAERRAAAPSSPIPGLPPVLTGALGGAEAAGGAGPGDLVGSVGTFDPTHLAWAAALLESLPDPLLAAAHEPASAPALVYGLLLDPKPEVRTKQVAALKRLADPDRLAELERLLPALERVPRDSRLPLVDLTLPALRRLSADQYRSFRETVGALAEADERIDLFEYALRRMILRHLEPRFAPETDRTEGKAVQFYALRGLREEISCLLSMLAHAGHESPQEAREAVAEGASELAGLVQVDALERDACRLSAFDAALEQLARVAPRLKERILRAAVAAAGHDRRVTGAEAELLRAIADGLGCPVPPFLAADPSPEPAPEPSTGAPATGDA